MEEIDKLAEQIKYFKQKLFDSYLLSTNDSEVLSEFTRTETATEIEFDGIFKSFEENIKSIIAISKLPFEMAFERAIKLTYEGIYRKHKILSLKGKIYEELGIDHDTVDDKELEESILKLSSNEFNDLILTDVGTKQILVHTLKFLQECAYESVNNANFLKSSKELINQTTLLTWSTLEVLLRDYFVKHLNFNPQKVKELGNDPLLKAKFDLKGIPTEKLIYYNFDLSNSMGDILIDNFDFSNIDVMKAIYRALLANDALNKYLKDEILWELYQTRNLIIHRGAIIDQKYISQTKVQLGLGEKLFITPQQLTTFLEKVVLIATCLKQMSK